MKKLFNWLFRRRKNKSGFSFTEYPIPEMKISDMGYSKEYDSMFSNFAVLMPTQAVKREEIVEDPRGAPIYAGCGANGLCACTGACRKILGYTKEPEKLAAHREYITRYNELQKNGMQHFYGDRKWDGDQIQFITNRKLKQDD